MKQLTVFFSFVVFSLIFCSLTSCEKNESKIVVVQDTIYTEGELVGLKIKELAQTYSIEKVDVYELKIDYTGSTVYGMLFDDRPFEIDGQFLIIDYSSIGYDGIYLNLDKLFEIKLLNDNETNPTLELYFQL